MPSGTESLAVVSAAPSAAAGTALRWAIPARVLLCLIVLCGAGVLGIRAQSPPQALRADAPAHAFAAERALEHVVGIAQRPRPTGSAALRDVELYLLAQLQQLGAEALVQTARLVSGAGVSFRGGRVRNVLGRIRGTGGSGAVLLSAHYDSVPTSPGAGDNASGVAAILETARALRARPRLRSDVILLFADGEETGQLGAEAFVRQHPWARDVAVALNFDARGSHGPVLMFETTPGNATLVGEVARVGAHPVASSLFYEVYRLLPNNTDFTRYKDAGWAGLNFAPIAGAERYHTALDTPQHLDARMLQHQGEYALSLASRLADRGGPATDTENAVYFTALGRLVHYPERWNTALALGLLVGFAALGTISARRSGVAAAAVIRGAVAVPATAVLAFGGMAAVMTGVRALDPISSFHAQWYMLATACFAASAVLLTDALLLRGRPAVDTLMGVLLWWILAHIAIVVLVPGAAYVAGLVVAGALGTIAVLVLAGHSALAATLVPAACVIAILAPTFYLVHLGVSLAATPVVAAIEASVLLTMLPQLRAVASERPWTACCASALVGVTLLGTGVAAARPDERHPVGRHVFYVLDTNAGAAAWASADPDVPEWVPQVRGSDAGEMAAIRLLATTGRQFSSAPAPVAALPGPRAAVLHDARGGSTRELRLAIASHRGAPDLLIHLTTPGADVQIDGVPVTRPVAARERPLTLWYTGVDGLGAELVIRAEAGPIALTLMDQSHGFHTLPAAIAPARPRWITARPGPRSDAVIVAARYEF